jgi:phage terminase large subunit GpA-like protein
MSVDKRTNVRFFMVGTDTAKETVFSRLQINEVGEGYCHFPIH